MPHSIGDGPPRGPSPRMRAGHRTIGNSLFSDQNRADVLRRTFLALLGVQALCAHFALSARAQLPASGTLRDAPLELGGDWGSSPRYAVGRVVERVRGVCLAGLRLLSDRQ